MSKYYMLKTENMAKKNACDDLSPLECEIIARQIQRRAEYRKEFLKKKSDPCLHSKEAGYVFDENLQRFNSLKATQFSHFKTNFSTALFGVCSIVLPMFAYGYLIYNERSAREQLIRTGKVKYKDRLFKLQ